MRRYYITQFNCRTPDGKPLPDDAGSVLIENGLDHKGANWWHDGGNHKPGDEPCFELNQDIEGEYYETGEAILFDEMAFSYDTDPLIFGPPTRSPACNAQDKQYPNLSWSKEDSAAAVKEGWDIFQCHGSDSGPWQLQRIDEPEDGSPPVFVTDQDAWLYVYNHNTSLANKALDFLSTYNPQEYNRMRKHVLGQDISIHVHWYNLLGSLSYVCGEDVTLRGLMTMDPSLVTCPGCRAVIDEREDEEDEREDKEDEWGAYEMRTKVDEHHESIQIVHLRKFSL